MRRCYDRIGVALRFYENAEETSFDIIVARKGVVRKGNLSSTVS